MLHWWFSMPRQDQEGQLYKKKVSQNDDNGKRRHIKLLKPESLAFEADVYPFEPIRHGLNSFVFRLTLTQVAWKKSSRFKHRCLKKRALISFFSFSKRSAPEEANFVSRGCRYDIVTSALAAHSQARRTASDRLREPIIWTMRVWANTKSILVR